MLLRYRLTMQWMLKILRKWKVSSWENLNNLHNLMVLVITTLKMKIYEQSIHQLNPFSKVIKYGVTVLEPHLMPCCTTTANHKTILQLWVRQEAKVMWDVISVLCYWGTSQIVSECICLNENQRFDSCCRQLPMCTLVMTQGWLHSAKWAMLAKVQLSHIR